MNEQATNNAPARLRSWRGLILVTPATAFSSPGADGKSPPLST